VCVTQQKDPHNLSKFLANGTVVRCVLIVKFGKNFPFFTPFPLLCSSVGDIWHGGMDVIGCNNFAS